MNGIGVTAEKSYLTLLFLEGHAANSRQQIKESITKNLVVIFTNTMTSFWNMSSASAPIHMKETSMKYCIRADIVIQTYKFFTWSTPMRKTISDNRMERESWM